MPRAKRPPGAAERAPTESAPLSAEARALVETLRALASSVEADPAIAAGLMAEMARGDEQATKTSARARPAREVVAAPLDPFLVMRQAGAKGLRESLASLELSALRAVVRAHRLDPARVSARWTASDRIIELIVEQVGARLNHGRAFERV
jgi:hypothetical protein